MQDNKSCLQCKLISIGCWCGIGGYLIQISRSQPKNTKLAFVGLGLGSIALGVGEIFDKSPFRQQQ